MTLIQAERKAKSIWGKEGMALMLAGEAQIGFYWQLSIHHYPTFHEIGIGVTFEQAFDNLQDPTHEAKV